MEKAPRDGVSVVIKRFIWHEQLNVHGEKLINAEEVVNFLRKSLSSRLKSSYICKRKVFHQIFQHVKSSDVDCNSTIYACDAIESTMKIHCIYALNKTTMMKNIVFFFANYLDGQWE